jgi:hypothetical protein
MVMTIRNSVPFISDANHLLPSAPYPMYLNIRSENVIEEQKRIAKGCESKNSRKCRDIHRGLANVISAGSKGTISSVIDDEGEHPA